MANFNSAKPQLLLHQPNNYCSVTFGQYCIMQSFICLVRVNAFNLNQSLANYSCWNCCLHSWRVFLKKEDLQQKLYVACRFQIFTILPFIENWPIPDLTEYNLKSWLTFPFIWKCFYNIPFQVDIWKLTFFIAFYREDGELEDGEIDDAGFEETQEQEAKEDEKQKNEKAYRKSRKKHKKEKEKKKSKRRKREKHKVS